MSQTGTYVWVPGKKKRDGSPVAGPAGRGRFVKVSDRLRMKGTPTMATKSFREQVMAGYRRVEERGQRFLGKRDGINRIWDRAATATH